MKERPILFSGAMVRAILAGRKTQTRRVVKPHPPTATATVIRQEEEVGESFLCMSEKNEAAGTRHVIDAKHSKKHPAMLCPYGAKGDRLWVREAFRLTGDNAGEHYAGDSLGGVIYCATNPDGIADFEGGWKPSIHMPRLASRITLEIESIRVERLLDITEEDAIAEGIEGEPGCWRSYEIIHEGPHKGRPNPHSIIPNRSSITSFRELWQSINGLQSWAANPWVWVVAFKRLEGGDA